VEGKKFLSIEIGLLFRGKWVLGLGGKCVLGLGGKIFGFIMWWEIDLGYR